MKLFTRLVEFISRLLGYCAAAMIFAAVLITCQMIFVRFVLNESTVWQTEVVVFLSIGATLIGLPYVQILKGHVSVDLLPSLLPPGWRKYLTLFSYALSISVIGIMFFYGFELWHFALERGWKTETVNAIPLWIPYIAMPVGFGFFVLQLFCEMWEIMTTKADDIPLGHFGLSEADVLPEGALPESVREHIDENHTKKE